MSEELKILESHKWVEVYFVRNSDKVPIEGKSGLHHIYRSGHYGRVEDFDFDSYDRFIQEHGYPPSATAVGKVFPNPDSTKPGIEIMASRKLFEHGGRFYYLLFDAFGLDTAYVDNYQEVVEHRRKIRPKIDKFLKEELYAPLSESREAYERNLVELIKKHLERPHNLFDLHVLSEPKAGWLGFDEIDLEEALDKGIRLSIDWLLANKLLGLYAVKDWNSR